MYKVKLTARAKKELRNISQSRRETIGLIFEDLKDDPSLGKPLTRELTSRFSYRVGIYRIIYKVSYQDQTIIILTAGHRGIVYQK